jgi:sugar lactone lactonase YvrE
MWLCRKLHRSSRLPTWWPALIALGLLCLAPSRDAARAEDLFVADQAGAIYRVQLPVFVVTTIASGGLLHNLVGLAADTTGYVYTSSYSDDRLLRVDVVSGEVTAIASGSPVDNPDGIAHDQQDHLYVCQLVGPDLIRVDVQTHAVTTLADGGLLAGQTAWCAFGTDGSLYLTNSSLRSILRYDVVTQTLSSVYAGSPLVTPFGIARGPDGGLYVADYNARGVYRFDPVGGTISPVSVGGSLSSPQGIVVTSDFRIFVTNASGSSLVEVDPGSGAQTVHNIGAIHPVGLAVANVGSGGELPPPPPAPDSLVASDDRPDGIALSWPDVEGEFGYLVSRNGVQIAVLAADVTELMDTPPIGTYEYCVRAYTSGGTSDPACDSGTRRDYFRQPRLSYVRDVPGDNGGKVALAWLASELDVAALHQITNYRIWRRLPAVSRARPGGEVRSRLLGGEVTFWEPVATLPAGYLQGYGYVAGTPQDSIAGSNPYTAFFVSAITSSATVFYDSAVDSGYSVDNVEPAVPRLIGGGYIAGTGVRLHWLPNGEPDLSHYAIYRGVAADFTPDGDHRVGTTADTAFVDATGTVNWYKVSAFDVHGNESGFATLAPDDIPVAALVQSLDAERDESGGVRVTLALSAVSGNLGYRVWRGSSDDWRASIVVSGPVAPLAGATVEFVDATAAPGVAYWYWVELLDGTRSVHLAGPVALAGQPGAGTASFVRMAGPNPAAGGTSFAYGIGSDAGGAGMVPVRITVHDVRGRLVRVLFAGTLAAGPHAIDWDGRGPAGGAAQAGIYHVRFELGGWVRTLKIVRL